MYYASLILISLIAIFLGWQYPAVMLIGGLLLGHALTEVLNDPTE